MELVKNNTSTIVQSSFGHKTLPFSKTCSVNSRLRLRQWKSSATSSWCHPVKGTKRLERTARRHFSRPQVSTPVDTSSVLENKLVAISYCHKPIPRTLKREGSTLNKSHERTVLNFTFADIIPQEASTQLKLGARKARFRQASRIHPKQNKRLTIGMSFDKSVGASQHICQTCYQFLRKQPSQNHVNQWQHIYNNLIYDFFKLHVFNP